MSAEEKRLAVVALAKANQLLNSFNSLWNDLHNSLVKDRADKCEKVRLPFTHQYVVVEGGCMGESKDSALQRYYKAQARSQVSLGHQKQT